MASQLVKPKYVCPTCQRTTTLAIETPYPPTCSGNGRKHSPKTMKEVKQS